MQLVRGATQSSPAARTRHEHIIAPDNARSKRPSAQRIDPTTSAMSIACKESMYVYISLFGGKATENSQRIPQLTLKLV